MLKLPQTLFTNVCTYVDTKTLFASKSVSKDWKKGTEHRDFWKEVMKAQNPDAMRFVTDYEGALKDSTEKPGPSLDDFRFLFTVHENGAKVLETSWKGNYEDQTFSGTDWVFSAMQGPARKLLVKPKLYIFCDFPGVQKMTVLKHITNNDPYSTEMFEDMSLDWREVRLAFKDHDWQVTMRQDREEE